MATENVRRIKMFSPVEKLSSSLLVFYTLISILYYIVIDMTIQYAIHFDNLYSQGYHDLLTY